MLMNSPFINRRFNDGDPSCPCLCLCLLSSFDDGLRLRTRMMRKGCGLTGGFGNRVNDVIRDVYEIVVDYVVSCIM